MAYLAGEDEEAIPPGAQPTPTPTVGAKGNPFATAAGGGGKGGGGGGGGERPTFNFPALPGFVAPGFIAPTLEQAKAEPGYQFRLQSGQDALQRSAAARGVLRSGGTLQDLVKYGQEFGQQEFGNVYNRALQAFDRKYQGAKDMYAPKLAQWQALANAETQAGLAAFGRRGGGGGGGGGAPMIPWDQILGPPPAPPPMAYGAAPATGPAPGGGYGYGDDDDGYYR